MKNLTRAEVEAEFAVVGSPMILRDGSVAWDPRGGCWDANFHVPKKIISELLEDGIIEPIYSLENDKPIWYLARKFAEKNQYMSCEYFERDGRIYMEPK